MSKIQAVLFNSTLWDCKSARRWLYQHNIKPIKKCILEGKNPGYYHYRIREPSRFNRFRTKKTTAGISFVIGFK